MAPSLTTKFHNRNFFFVQDNNPKHTSKMASKWVRANKIKVLPWASSSPNLNIIEHVWDYIDCRLRACATLPSNIDKLWVVLQEQWEKMDLEFIRGLYRSMQRRVKSLHLVKGRYTKY